MLVDNLVAILPDHAQHCAASGRPAIDDAIRPTIAGRAELKPAATTTLDHFYLAIQAGIKYLVVTIVPVLAKPSRQFAG